MLTAARFSCIISDMTKQEFESTVESADLTAAEDLFEVVNEALSSANILYEYEDDEND